MHSQSMKPNRGATVVHIRIGSLFFKAYPLVPTLVLLGPSGPLLSDGDPRLFTRIMIYLDLSALTGTMYELSEFGAIWRD